MAPSFDTLQYTKKLQQAGFTEKQAEIQAETFKKQAELINKWAEDNLATKHDLKETEERLANRINEMSYKITVKLGSIIAGTVVILGILMPIILKFLGA